MIIRFTRFCIILTGALIFGSSVVHAQDDIGIERYWRDGRPSFNIFQLREHLKKDESLSDIQRHLARTYLHIYALDFDKAEAELALAKEKISGQEVNQDINDQIYDISRDLLLAKGSYGELTELYAEVEGQDSELAKFYSKLSSFNPSTKRQSEPYELSNIASEPNKRITIKSTINGQHGELLLDTGGLNLFIRHGLAKAANAERSDVSRTIAFVGLKDTYSIAGINTLEIGPVTLKDIPTMVPQSDTSPASVRLLDKFDGLIGFDHISKLGRFSLIVSDDTVSSLRFDFPSKEEISDIPQNLLIRQNKLIAEIKIDGQPYSCLVDTGSPVTFLSERIYERHKKSTALKRLSPKAARRKGLTGYYKKPAFLERLDVEIADRTVQFSNIELVDTKGTWPDYCFIGLPSIIQAGGATIDISNRIITFGNK